MYFLPLVTLSQPSLTVFMQARWLLCHSLSALALLRDFTDSPDLTTCVQTDLLRLYSATFSHSRKIRHFPRNALDATRKRMNVYTVKLKLSNDERRELDAAISKSKYFRSSKHLDTVDCIVTNILTTERIKRECSGLTSSSTVPVLKAAVFLTLLQTHATAPSVTREYLLSELQKHARIHLELPSSNSTSAHSELPATSNIPEPSYPLVLPVKTLPPTLLQHESTEDPTDRLFRQHVGLIHADTSWCNKYACQRRSPLICPNQELVDVLLKLRLQWTIEDDERRVRAYSSAIASLKAYPIKIKDADEVKQLEGCGGSIANKVSEYLQSGTIHQVQSAWQDEALLTKYTFWNVHGLGAKGVHLWYNERGYRSLNDAIQSAWDTLPRPQQIGLKYYDDFLIKIPRSEVEEIVRVVHDAAQRVFGHDSPVDSTCCGSYRRGKAESGDVDVVLTHISIHDTAAALRRVIHELEERSFVKEIISERTERDGSKTSFSGYAIGMLVCRSVKTGVAQPMRRVDIIVARPDNYITAVLGWSGSITFERDLRLYVKRMFDLTFDSTGLTTIADNKQRVDCQSWTWTPGASIDRLEKELFKFLKLNYIEPVYRNAE
jgi:DNA polymerase IV